MALRKTIYKYLLFLGSILILTQCSVEKNTGLSRLYQSLTSRDNIYFNGIEAYKAGVIKAESASTDDYSEILKVFEYSDPKTVVACTPDMERAIQKASKVISLKSITAQPDVKDNATLTEKEKEFASRKEFNEWVDDSYLLMAKARFYKHDYELAKSTFSFCFTDANDPLIRIEANIWIARICNETADYTESSRILTGINISTVPSRSLKALYYTTLADLYNKQKRYEEAIPPLTSSLNYLSGKKVKYRLTYLLAQLNEETGKINVATALYHEVVKMNPPYEIEFNARINMAGVFDISNGNPEDIKKELEKMLNDSKNKEFRDQLYYVLGNLAMKEGSEQEGLDYYHKSAAVSTQNATQKGKSYLALAGYYYEKPDYIDAQKYYDSAVIFLDTKYPDYQLYKIKSESLNELVSQLMIVQTEDSLQRVALMSEGERSLLISEIINKLTVDEMNAQMNGSSDSYNLGEYYENERRISQISSQEGAWYFYNQASMTFGRTEFRRRWGERKLEDNWRRSNKSIVTIDQLADNSGTATEEKTDSLLVVADNKSPAYYLRNLPMNDSLINISNLRIATALFNAGRVYSDRIEDKDKAVEEYQSLIARYPGNDLTPESVYNIYTIYKESNNSNSEKYRQMLLEKYPDTEFALIISDPEYFKKKSSEAQLAGILYENAYNAYLNENFIASATLCDEALVKYSTNELAPKFQLLHAYSTARLKDERTFKDELSALVKQWPGTDESQRAAEIIAFLNKEIPELKVEEEKALASELYNSEPDTTHFFVVVILNPAFNINQATFDVINFNIDNYTNKNYKTQGTLVDNKYILINVGSFDNSQQALEYFRAFNPETIIRNAVKEELRTFIISTGNLQILNNDKDPSRYKIFFDETYLKQGE